MKSLVLVNFENPGRSPQLPLSLSLPPLLSPPSSSLSPLLSPLSSSGPPWSLSSSSWRYFYAYHCRHSCQMRWLENHLNLINTYSVALENLDNYRGDNDERYEEIKIFDLLPSWWVPPSNHLSVLTFCILLPDARFPYLPAIEISF